MYYVEAHPDHTHSSLRKSPRTSPGFVCDRVLPNCWGSVDRPTQLRFSPDLFRRCSEQFARHPLLGILVPRVCLFIGWCVCITPTRRACYFSFSAPQALSTRSLRFRGARAPMEAQLHSLFSESCFILFSFLYFASLFAFPLIFPSAKYLLILQSLIRRKRRNGPIALFIIDHIS